MAECSLIKSRNIYLEEFHRRQKTSKMKQFSSLLDDLEDGGEDFSRLKINESYARRFEHNKKRDDLQKLKVIRDHNGESTDEEDEEVEDELGVIPVAVEAKIFDTLAKIKKKDPIIYQSNVNFFDDESNEEDGENTAGRIKPERKVYLKDVALLNAAAEGEDSGGEAGVGRVDTYSHEQEVIRREFLQAAAQNKEEDDLLKLRPKPKEEQDDEENFLEDAARKYFGGDEELDEGDVFLKNYLLNQGWIDKDNGTLAPRYEEIVGEIEEDEEALDQQENFEAKYNFRFEEGASSQVEGHRRKVEGSVRKKPEKRKEVREAKAVRQAEEDLSRREELKRLKNVKKQELEERLKKVKEVAGEVKGMAGEDLDGEFDPEEYDRMMQKMFGESYYEEEDQELEEELEEKEEQEGEEEGLVGGGEDKLVGMEDEEKRGFKEVRVKSQKDGKPKEEERIALENLLEEYYKLDYEDMVGGLATRFKYRDVRPNRYGLSTEDILKLDDKDLNQIVSVKKLAPYRGDEWQVRWTNRKTEGEENRADEVKVKKSKREKDRGREWFHGKEEVPTVLVSSASSLSKAGKKNLKRKLQRMQKRGEKVESMELSRLQSYGVEKTGAVAEKKQKKDRK